MTENTDVYLLAQLMVTDHEALMRDYAAPLQPLNEKYGAKVLAASPQVSVLEGQYTCNLTVLLKFPSLQAQQGWYTDAEYQPLIKRRQALTDAGHSTLIVLPALAGSTA